MVDEMTFLNYQQPINCYNEVTIETLNACFNCNYCYEVNVVVVVVFMINKRGMQGRIETLQTGFPIEQTFIDDLRRHYGNEVCNIH